MTSRWMMTACCVFGLLACRGEPPVSAQSLSQAQLTSLVDSLMPGVAKATGVPFKSTPQSAVRSRDQVRSYLLAKLDQELPPERLEGIVATYRLLGLIPDSLDVSKLLVDLYTEQVAGFYDPDSTTLFAVAGGDRAQLRLILAHELVHALQHQYVPLDSVLHDLSNADRLAAAQAVLEGQATLASLTAIVPNPDVLLDDGFWETFRDQIRGAQAGMKVFNTAPLVIREGLVFPYLAGAEFMRWWRKNHGNDQPFGALLPSSTEQILHPDRYARGDRPISVAFVDDTSGVMHEDTFGEFEMNILRSVQAGINEVPIDLPLGWGGDRLRVYRSPEGPALVWVTVWDTARDAEAFKRRIGDGLVALPRAGHRKSIEPLDVGGRSGMRVVIAPEGWARWESLPGVR